MRKLVAVCTAFCALTLPVIAADVSVLGTYPPPRPVYSWTGCRVGVNIGGGSAPTSWNDQVGTVHAVRDPVGTLHAVPSYLGDHTASGVIGGGQLGCDYQVGSFVFGVQGLYDLTGMKASNIQGQPVTFEDPNGIDLPVGPINETFIQSSANVTARIGYAVLPNVLLYAKAGVARNHNLYNISTPGLQSALTINPLTNQVTRTALPNTIIVLGNNSPDGPLIGAGVEWAVFGTNVSLFLEYNYLHFGTNQATLLSVITPEHEAHLFPLDITQNVNLVLFGINYRFFGGP